MPEGGTMPLAFAPDGQEIFSLEADRRLHVRDAATGKELRQLTSPRFPEPSRDRIYALASSNPDRPQAACLLCHTSL